MGTIIDITQYKLERALASEDIAAKIKLRRLSHANLIEHVKNIPYKVVKAPKIKNATFHFPIEQKQLRVSPKKYIQLVTGSSRPISAKEDKTANIRKHSDSLISLVIEKEQTQDTTSVESVVLEKNITQTQDAIITQEIQQDTGNKTNENIVDFGECVAKLNNEAQLVKTVMNDATLAQQQADASDEQANKMSIEVNELEKQEEEAKKQDVELGQKVIAAYENQTKTLALARKEYEDLIKEANARKQVSDNKIAQFQSKMEDIRNNIADVNESIARKQSILSALQQTEFSDPNNIIQFTNGSEEKVKRIA